MLKVSPVTQAQSPTGQLCPQAAGAAAPRDRPRIALLSNPKSTGNLAQLPRIREY